MAIQAEARIVVRGGSEALKTLQGIRRETSAAGSIAKKAAAAQQKAEKSVLEQRLLNADRFRRAQEKSAQESIRLARRVAEAQVREAARAANAAEREARRAARVAEREAKNVTRAAQREAALQARAAKRSDDERESAATKARKGRIGLMGAATAGILAGASTAFSTARGIAGQRDIQDRVRTGMEFRERFIITSTQAGATGARAQDAQAKILGAANATGVDQMDLLGAVERGQSEFNAFGAVTDNIDSLARQAKGAGTDVASFTSAVLRMQQAFGIADDKIKDIGNLILASASAGAIEAGDIANDFAPTAGLFAQNTGHRGEAGLREFLGVAQAMGTLGSGSAESATMTENLLGELSRKEVQKKLRRIGVNVTDPKTGEVRGFADIVSDLAGNKKFQSATTRQEIFTEKRGRVGLEALIGAYKRTQAGESSVDIRSIAGVDAAEGEKKTREVLQQLQESGLLDIQRESARMQSDVIGDLRSYTDQVRALQGASNRLESAFGPLALQADAARNALGALGLSAIAFNTALGGGSSGAAGGAVGALGKFGAALGVFSAAYLLSRAGLDAAGVDPEEDVGATLYDAVHGRPAEEKLRTPHRALSEDQKAAVEASRSRIAAPTFNVVEAGRPGPVAPYVEGDGRPLAWAVKEVGKEVRGLRDDLKHTMRDRQTNQQRGPR